MGLPAKARAGSYGYDPYGNTTASGATSMLQYTGRENDGTYYYYRARYYDPATARFLSEDPLNIGGGANLYAYAGGNPISFIDPFGLSSVAYNTQNGTLTVYNGLGNILGTFAAGNNTTSTSRGPWPPGDYDYLGHIAHPPDPNGSYGLHGNFVFDQPGCIGCGVHSGRANKGGPNAKTLGCIRSADPATKLMNDLNQSGDPLDGLYVGPNPPLGTIPSVLDP